MPFFRRKPTLLLIQFFACVAACSNGSGTGPSGSGMSGGSQEGGHGAGGTGEGNTPGVTDGSNATGTGGGVTPTTTGGTSAAAGSGGTRTGGSSGNTGGTGTGGIVVITGGTSGSGSGGMAVGGQAGCPVYPAASAFNNTTMPQSARPQYLVPVQDPVFKTWVTRIGENAAFSAPQFRTNNRSPNPYHHYAKSQPWNADESLIMLAGWPSAILDGKTYKLLRSVWTPGAHYTWLHNDPNRIVTVQNARTLMRFNMMTEQSEVLHTFTEFDSVSYGEWESDTSNDDRFIALQAKKGTAVTVMVYDMLEKKVATTLDGGTTYPNNVTMSQTGKYLIVQWGVAGLAQRQGITLHDRVSGTYLRHLSNSGGKHYDPCIDQAGDEVTVATTNSTPALQMVRLRDGFTTELLSRDVMGYNIHVSCRNIKRPGWAYISQFAKDLASDGPKAFYQTVFAVKLDSSKTVMRFAHEQHSEVDDYDRSPFAVPNRDGSRVMWRSDWRDGSSEINSYVAGMRCPN
jgi:hypothetical protein